MMLTGGIEEEDGKNSLPSGLAAATGGGAAEEAGAELIATGRLPAGGQSAMWVLTYDSNGRSARLALTRLASCSRAKRSH
jgi:hypothetical protein